MRSLQLEVY